MVLLRGESQLLRRLIAGVVVAVLICGAASAASAASERILVIDGRGFGHGRGMGQWGAREAASRGLSWQRIVRHYYPGARVATRPRGETIRVLVRSERTVTFTAYRPLRVSAGRRLLARSEGWPRAVRLRRDGDAIVIAHGASIDGPWRATARTARPIAVGSAGPVWIAESDGEVRAYRGSFRVRKRREHLGAINVVALEAYVAGVVPREMPAVWPSHALRAQSIAARTYATRVKRHARRYDTPFDICASAACQVYGGFAYKPDAGSRPVWLTHRRTTAAVRATARRVLAWRGVPIFSQYSSSTGGHTTSGGMPYLRPVPDTWDRSSPYHRWREYVSTSTLSEIWPVGTVRAIRAVARDGHGAWGGRADRVRLTGTRGAVTIDATRFASKLGLRSDWFRFDWHSGRYVFTFDMGEGTRHAAVYQLQTRLRRAGYFPADVDRTNYFGPITKDSLQRYQRARGIRATGYLGPITRRSLNR